MKWRTIALALITLALAGCQLSQAQQPEQPIATATSTVTAAPLLTATPSATTTPTQTATPTETTMPTRVALAPTEHVAACVPQRPQWPTYQVQPGDTLARIARDAGTTTGALAQVNCLVDRDLIFPGQRLRVPRLPSVPVQPVEPPPAIPLIDLGPQPAHICVVVPNGQQADIWGAGVTGRPAAILLGTVRFVRRADNAYVVELPPGGVQGWVSAMEAHLEGTSCPDVSVPVVPGTPVPAPTQPLPQCPPLQAGQGRVVVEPGIPVRANCVELNPGATVTVRWPQAPSDFAMIEFWARTESGSTNVIGVDNNPADGASITWIVPTDPFNMRLYAIPYTDMDAGNSGEITIYTGTGQN